LSSIPYLIPGVLGVVKDLPNAGPSSFNIAVIAALSFLGFGLQPPGADWGHMINENRQGPLADQPRGPAPLATAKQSFLDSLASIGFDLWVPGIRMLSMVFDLGRGGLVR
jgi:hypothetical protein